MTEKKIDIVQILKLFIWKYFKFSRPFNLNVSGKILFNRYATINFDKQSQLSIDGDLEINNANLLLVKSNLKTGKLVLENTSLDLYQSQVILGDRAHLRNAHLEFKESKLSAQENFRIHSVEIFSTSSQIEVGSYFFGQHLKAERLNWNFFESKMVVGKNTRLQCAIAQNNASLSIGSNTFINAGTAISCLSQIIIGDFVMISYDCLIFDNNSHSTDYKARRQEIEQGFPNGTKPGMKDKPKSAAIIIANDVWIGARCTILKGISMEARTIAASNTIVTKSVPEQTLVFGNPNCYKPILTT
jgi:acetyltransferase-like isoleucine patch superfamily enzyme